MPADVLIVDDDPTFRALAVRLLEKAGLHVAGEADTVRRAMEVILDLRPTAVLLDVGLPDGSGITLAGELTSLAWHPHVVLTSSDADAASADDVNRTGAAAFIAKESLTEVALRKVFAVA